MLKKAAFLAFLLAVGFGMCYVAVAQESATVHGTVYYWFTLEPLSNAIVEVNTTPRQIQVATDGSYSLSLPEGSYTITASYWQDNVLLYYAEENLTILGTGGDYIVDLLVFPVFDEDDIPLDNDLIPDLPDDVDNTDGTDNNDNNLPPDGGPGDTGSVWLAVLAVVAGAAIVGIFYYLKSRQKKTGAGAKAAEVLEKPMEAKIAERSPPVKIVGLPSDLSDIVDKIRGAGGRINQLELRQMLPYSEAKVSLMLADLESRGLIRKIKKGRGNIIILKED
jgi:uncharacterized membrane protein